MPEKISSDKIVLIEVDKRLLESYSDMGFEFFTKNIPNMNMVKFMAMKKDPASLDFPFEMWSFCMQTSLGPAKIVETLRAAFEDNQVLVSRFWPVSRPLSEGPDEASERYRVEKSGDRKLRF